MSSSLCTLYKSKKKSKLKFKSRNTAQCVHGEDDAINTIIVYGHINAAQPIQRIQHGREKKKQRLMTKSNDYSKTKVPI